MCSARLHQHLMQPRVPQKVLDCLAVLRERCLLCSLNFSARMFYKKKNVNAGQLTALVLIQLDTHPKPGFPTSAVTSCSVILFLLSNHTYPNII